jgi:RHS repeat-associated protein
MKSFKVILILALLSFSFFLVRDSVYSTTNTPITAFSEIPLPGNPHSIAINPFTNQAVVTSIWPNQVSVIDLGTRTVLSNIPVGRTPLGVAIDPELNLALVSSVFNNTISVIDLNKDQVVKKIPVGEIPLGIAVDGESHIGLVANFQDNSVSAIDLQTYRILKKIRVGEGPIDIAIDPGLGLALVVNSNDDHVSIIELDTFKVTGSVPVGMMPTAISINPETHLAAVANLLDSSITVINLQNWQTNPIEVGEYPNDVAINPLDNRALVLCDNGKSLLLIDLYTHTIIDRYDINKWSTGVAVNPFTNMAVVVNDKTDSLTLIQLPNPIPEITSLHPSIISRGSKETRVLIQGSGFIKTSVANLLQPTSYPLHTESIDNHHLEVTIPEALLKKTGTYRLVVTNPPPDGGTSNPIGLQINNPIPSLTALEPAEALAGTKDLTLTVYGTGFFDDTIVSINGKPRSFILLSEKKLQIRLTAEDLKVGAYLEIAASNPPPGGGRSSPLVFKVLNPIPSLSSINPTSITAGSPDFTLTLTGDNFLKTSIVSFNNQQFSSRYISKNQIEATIPSEAIKIAGNYPVKAINPAPGGGETSTLIFTVKQSIIPPKITGFSPTVGPVGTSVTINGNNFNVSGLRVAFNGAPAVVSKFTNSSITTAVPLGAFTGPITVTTSGGSDTSTSNFTVTSLYDFTLSVSPQNARATPGGQVTYTVTVTGTEGFSYLVALTIQGLPQGFSGFFSPKTITSGQSSTLTISACDCTLSSPAALTIIGSATIEGKTVTRSAEVSLELLSPGITSLVGRVLDTDGKPIKNVTIWVEDMSTTTDESGNFLLENPPTGDHVVLIDGSTASTDMAKYPSIPITMNIVSGQTNSLPYVPHLHAQKNFNFTPINPAKETKVEDPEVPGLQLRIPPGVDIIGWDGKPNTKVSVRKVPIDALPVPPLPPTVQGKSVYMFYFDKIGGGVPTIPIPVTAPNDLGLQPGEKAELWYFNESPYIDEAPNEWSSAGMGTVSADGLTISTDPGVGIPRFCCGAIIWAPTNPTGPNVNPDGCPRGIGDPVDPATGIFIYSNNDLTIPGRIPIRITRTYRTLDAFRGPYGIGTYFSYDWYVIPSGNMATLVIPPGSRIPFSRQADGTYINTTQPSYLGARLTLNPNQTWVLRMKDGSTYKFNAALQGLLIEQADRNGNKLTFIREVEGNVTKIIGADGRTMVSFQIVILGRDVITQMTDIIDRKVVYTYDYSADPGTGRLKSVTDPAGGVTRYEYDTQGRMTAIIDPRGNLVVRNSYDANGRVCQQEHGDGGIFKYYYVTADQATTPSGRKLLAEAVSGGPISQAPCFSPVSSSPVVATVMVDPNGNPTTFQFDGTGFLSSTTNALGQTTTYKRGPGSNLLSSITDPLGRVTRRVYDNKGNITSVTDPMGNVTIFTYEPNFSQIETIIDAQKHLTTFGYDVRGNLTSITDPLGYTWKINYDRFGQPISIADPLGNTTTFEYDDSGNLVAAIDPLGNKSSRMYDKVSRLIAFTDPNGRSSVFDYDLMDRIKRLQDSLGKDTTFDYDLNGNLLFVTDANKNKRGYSNDVKNRLETTTDPLGKTETYTYDFNDNLISFKDRKGQTTAYTYDSLNRSIKVTYADENTIAYKYDAVGRLTRIDDSVTGPIEYTYTTFGCSTCARTSLDKIIQETTSLGTINYTYDELGRRKSMSVVGGPLVDYRYDLGSRLIEVSQAGLGFVSIDHDKAGRRTSLILPNGITTEYNYDKASRLLNMKHSTVSNVIEDLTYTYDAAGNRISFGRINPQAELPKAVTAAFNEANQMLTFNDENLRYDANGNLIEKKDGNGATTYIWDARNQLTRINGPGLTATFKYDALGRRIEKTINGRSIQFLYDGSDIVAEVEEGVITATYLRGLYIDEVFARMGRNMIRYYQTDALGSVIALTDENGSIKTQYAYDPFGNVTISGEPSDNPFQYTGRENDGTGLYYYRARYYSPELQRFISEDPIGLGSGDVNFYAYVGNNPINNIDPLGLAETSGCPKKSCWDRYWEEFERNRVPGAEFLGLPTSFISGGLTVLLNAGPWATEKIAQNAAIGAFESQRLTGSSIYLKNYFPRFFSWGTAARFAGKASWVVTVGYLSADVTTLIYTWITFDCKD